MSKKIAELAKQIRELEEQIEVEFAEQRESINYRIHEQKIIFEADVREHHQQLKMGVLKFLRASPILTLVTAPVIYAMIVPLVFLDLSVTLYQWICFSAWGAIKVKRADYIVIDRQLLGYLNAIEKFNCVYCSYGNGVIAFAHEVSSRTEQYWCPIKHARKVKGAHHRVRRFIDYGDGEGWRQRLEGLRRDIE